MSGQNRLFKALAVRGSTVKYLTLFFIIIFSNLSYADKWGSPEVTSALNENSSIVVRVTPGDGFLNHDLKSSEKDFAKAQYFKWNGSNAYEIYQEITLKNPAAPIRVLVANDGTLVTIDNWYSTGSGKVIVIYAPNGELIKEYELTGLFPKKADFDKLGRSVSSIQWRCTGLQPELRYGYLYVPHVLGGSLRFSLQTGGLDKIQPDSKCK
jgi:hypothetical protein